MTPEQEALKGLMEGMRMLLERQQTIAEGVTMLLKTTAATARALGAMVEAISEEVEQ